MSTKSREVIWVGQIRGAKIRGEGARERAKKAIREADRAEALAKLVGLLFVFDHHCPRDIYSAELTRYFSRKGAD